MNMLREKGIKDLSSLQWCHSSTINPTTHRLGSGMRLTRNAFSTPTERERYQLNSGEFIDGMNVRPKNLFMNVLGISLFGLVKSLVRYYDVLPCQWSADTLVVLPWCQRESPSTFRPSSPQFFDSRLKSAPAYNRRSTESEKFFFVLLSAILSIFSHIKNYTPKQVNEQFQPKWTAALSRAQPRAFKFARICCLFFVSFFYRQRGGCERRPFTLT